MPARAFRTVIKPLRCGDKPCGARRCLTSGLPAFHRIVPQQDVHMNSSEQHRFDLVGAVRREVPHAARTLFRTPSFSLIAFVTLALGIGATTAIYTVLDAVALRPMPYRNADRL